MADAVGRAQLANMAMLGALLAWRSIVALEAVERALRSKLTGDEIALLEANIDLLHRGYAQRVARETNRTLSRWRKIDVSDDSRTS